MAKNKLQPCKVCNTKTRVVFNIDFKAVPICEGCACSIFLQQANWFVQQQNEIETKKS